MPSALVHEVYRQVASFHAQPLKEKLKIKLDKHNVGYLPMMGDTLRTSVVAHVTKPNMSEAFFMARDLAPAITMPLTGWLAGRFGIKYIFLASIIGFTIASALCGAATSLGELVAFRGLQGVAGAGLIPLSQATLLQINPPERHGQAMAVFGVGTICGPIMGPALGGWLTQDYSWRWVFYINLPIGLLCTLGVLVFIRHSRNIHREPFDVCGFLALSLGIGALQLLLDRGELKVWFNSGEIWIEATIAGLGLYLFSVHTVTTDGPSFLNRDLLKSTNFAAGTVLMFAGGLIMTGPLALLSTDAANPNGLSSDDDRLCDDAGSTLPLHP